MKTGHTRRRFLETSGSAVLGLGAAGLAAPAIAAKTRTLTISTWGGDTEDAIKRFVGPRFEREHKCKLLFDIGSMGARYNKIRAQGAMSTIDVFFSTDEPVFNGIRRGLFAEINPANLPNMKDLHDWATPTQGYGVAYGLITFGLAYHTGLVKTPPTEWNDLWRNDLRTNLAVPAVAHSMMPGLVIRSAELAGGDDKNVKPGLAKLAQLRPKKLVYFWTQYAPLLKTGDVVLAPEFDYYAESMKERGYPVEWVNPRDKGFASIEHLSILKNSKNKELAEAFLNAMMDHDVQLSWAKEYFQGPSNKRVKLEGKLANRTSYGSRVDNMRFFDGRMIDRRRAAWSELLNTQVIPSWS